MTTPNRSMIYAKALELWRNDRLRNGQPFETTPEDYELREEGYFITAQQILMFGDNQPKAYTDQFSNLEKQSEQQSEQPLEQPLETPFEVKPFTVDTKELMATGVFCTGTRQSGKSNTAKHIVRQLINEGKVVFIIDPTQVWQKDFSELSHLIISEPHGQTEITWDLKSTVFDTSQLTPKSQQRFTELFCAAVFNHATVTPKPLRPQIVCVYEEAHTAMENNKLNGNTYQNTKRFLTQGANFGLSFIAITQFPALVDKLPLKSAQQRYFGKTSEPNDLKYLKAYLGKHVTWLPSMPLGQFLYVHSGRLSRIATVKYEENQNTEGSKFAYAYTS